MLQSTEGEDMFVYLSTLLASFLATHSFLISTPLVLSRLPGGAVSLAQEAVVSASAHKYKLLSI